MSRAPRVGLHLSVQAGPDESHEQAIATALDDARAADRLGLSSVLFAEHHFLEDGWVPQALALATAAGAVTERIRVGSNIAILPLQHPVAVAEQAVLTDLVSGGRCVLGVGVGWRPADFAGYGLPFDTRFRAFSDGLKMLRGLLRGESVTYEGVTHRCEDARLRLLPVRPEGPPIIVGATGPQGIRRAARLADGWMMSPQVRVSELQAGQREFDAAREAAGLEPVVEVPLRREAYVADTDEQAWAAFRAGLEHQYGDVYGSRHPDYPTGGSLAEVQAWAEDLAVVGSVDTVAEEFAALGERLGVTEILVRTRLPGVPEEGAERSLELLGAIAERLGTSTTQTEGASS